MQETLANVIDLVAKRLDADVCSIYLTDADFKSLTLSATIDNDAASVDVAVELDYVYPTGDLVYNAGRNTVSTTGGIQTMLSDGNWPVVSTATVTVPCM